MSVVREIELPASFRRVRGATVNGAERAAWRA
jgi:hypothetical protein